MDGSFNATASRLRGRSVLIVEDSGVVAHVVETLLKDAGMVIAGMASTPTDGERLARGHVPQLAVVDFQSMTWRLIWSITSTISAYV